MLILGTIRVFPRPRLEPSVGEIEAVESGGLGKPLAALYACESQDAAMLLYGFTIAELSPLKKDP